MLIKKSNCMCRVKFKITNSNINPVIFYLKSEVEISIETIDSFYNNGVSSFFPLQTNCTVIIKDLSFSNFIKYNKLVNNVLSYYIMQGGTDSRIDMEIKKGDQFIYVCNVMLSPWVTNQYGKHLNIKLTGDYNGITTFGHA